MCLTKDTATRVKAPDSQSRPAGLLQEWLRLQRSLAEKTGLTLATVDSDATVIGQIESDNSICEAMRRSPRHYKLCTLDREAACGEAFKSGQRVERRCHAGLHFFAAPVTSGGRRLAVLGGRAFTSGTDYRKFINAYSDLEGVQDGESLRNVAFVDSRELREAAELVSSTAEYHFERQSADPISAEGEAPELLDAHLEIIRLADQLESKNRSMAHFYDFLRGVASTLDSQKVYQSVLAKFSEIMKAERSSLMILNEESDELALEAAVGAEFELSNPIRVKIGEGIAGSVAANGLAMVVRDMDTDVRMTHGSRSNYRTKSFISFPITLGPRKVGVINFTDRSDGGIYDADDLSLLELMAPHLALIIDRTEWHKKAEAYQRMSLTDPLTGLPNRRYLEERLFEEVERSKRHGTPLAFIIVDVDRFKTYNDIYGHTNADQVLVKAAQILRRSVRAIDMPARFAGDEFCIVLPETELDDAARAAERLRKAVSQVEFKTEQGELMGRVTISIGVSSFCASRNSPLAIIETADRALYQAKTRGRNCVAVYTDALAHE